MAKTVSFKHWTPADDEYLINNKDKPYKQLASDLNRTYASIRSRMFTKGLCPHRIEKRNIGNAWKKWTPEQDEYLINNIGKISLARMSLVLGRTHKAITQRLFVLGISVNFRDHDEFLGAEDLADALQCNRVRIYYWIKHNQLKAKMVNLRNLNSTKRYYRIEIDDFWEFVKEYPKTINFKKFEKNTLGAEPEFMVEYRKKYNDTYLKRPWTEKDKSYLRNHYKTLEVKEIAENLNRTRMSIQHMMKKLRLVKVIHTLWDAEEIEQLRIMIEQGCDIDTMGEEFGRTNESIVYMKKKLIKEGSIVKLWHKKYIRKEKMNNE